MKIVKPSSRDYLAEMCVAGVLADKGWNVYFPHRDQGFDMIATFATENGIIMRPIQVKGKYPQDGKLKKPTYGYVGKLTATHPDMVLAIPYFSAASGYFPDHIAWVPFSHIKSHSSGYRAEYAQFGNGKANPRPGFTYLFDELGLSALAAMPDMTGG